MAFRWFVDFYGYDAQLIKLSHIEVTNLGCMRKGPPPSFSKYYLFTLLVW